MEVTKEILTPDPKRIESIEKSDTVEDLIKNHEQYEKEKYQEMDTDTLKVCCELAFISFNEIVAELEKREQQEEGK
jgi:hypothetical protein